MEQFEDEIVEVTEDEILSQLRRASDNALGQADSYFSDRVEKLNEYYHGKPYGNEVEGKSKFVTREVYETIESIMPYMAKVFFSSDKAVIFDPEDEDDVLGAEQETEYVNWVFYRDNPGFKLGYTWIKDGLMNKVGYIKAVRESSPPVRTEYENLTENQLAQMYADNPNEDQFEILQQEDGLFTAVVFETPQDRTVLSNIPPEEFKISEGAIEICDAHYCAHNALRPISEIRAMGFDVEDDIDDDADDVSFSTLKTDRHEDITATHEFGKDEQEGASREVLLREEYMRIDLNGDGIDELWQFFRIGDRILHQEEVSEAPFYAWSPIIVPHRHIGSTPADPVMDIQLLKSKVTRNMLDNQERINSGRHVVMDGQVNLDDLMSNSNIIRESFSGAVREMPTTQLDQSAFQLLGYADSLAERRTGVSERGQGLDPKMFNSNTAMGTAEIVMSSAEQKLELIARIFAETGLKALMLGIHRLGMTSENPVRKIRNNNGQFIDIDPRSWRDRYDMSVTVGIGNGSKSQQMYQMQMIEQTMATIAQGGGLGTLVTPENIWNFAMEKVRISGRRDGQAFFTKPTGEEQPPSAEQQKEMAELQLEQEKMALRAKEVAIKEQELLIDVRKLELEERMADLKEQIHEDTNTFKLAEFKLEEQQSRAVKIGSD